MPYRNIASRTVFFQDAAAISRPFHPGNDGFAIRKPGSGLLFERAYFGDGHPRFLDDVRFTLSHSPNNRAGLQVKFANRSALHVTQCDTTRREVQIGISARAERTMALPGSEAGAVAWSTRQSIPETCCTTALRFAVSGPSALHRGTAAAWTALFGAAA